jgi:Predicted nucleic acid-binding protein, contains PIN domain
MSKVVDALNSVRQLGLDTPLFIYFVERNPTYVAVCREVIRLIDTGTVTGCSSVVTLTEMLTLPKRLGRTSLEQEYRELLTQSPFFRLVPVGIEVAERAAELRARYNLRTPDALQVATALVRRCEAFLTNDARLKRVTEIRVLTLDDLRETP